MRIKRFLISTASLSAVLALGCQGGDLVVDEPVEELRSTEKPAPTKVGEEVIESLETSAIAASTTGVTELVWQREIHVPGATYIAPHFSSFSLPEGAFLKVSDGNNTRSRTYAGNGKAVPGSDGFWSMHMPGDRAILQLYSRIALPAGAIVMDRYARGTDKFTEFKVATRDGVGAEAICGADDSDWAQCYQSSEATAYDKGRAVARLMINGTSACTGWLLGSEGHIMTNEHCIGNASSAANTDYEFMAEGSCNNNCTTWGGCPGVVEADTGTLIQVDSALDYALIQLPVNLTSTYGYLQLRQGGGQVGERIYIVQHPQAWGKRIALKDGSNDATISSLNEAPCSGGPGDVGYFADTQGGSSGSPVLAYSDNLVVALHHCAFCPNRGVPVDPIINDLGNNLPADAIGGDGEPPPPPPPPTCAAKGESCTVNADCCSNKCKGRRGNKTCK